MDNFDAKLHEMARELLAKARELRQTVNETPGRADKRLEELGQQIEGNAEKLLAQQIKPVLIVPRAERKL